MSPRNVLLRLVAIGYAMGARLHRAFMARTAGGRGRLACAVVSVGGLTVGGAGKTPVAARLASALQRRGWRVVIASRGYKGRAREAVSVVSDGRFLHSRVELAGDESFVLAAHAPGVPVLVGRDRRVVGHHAVSAFDAEILVLDDGFQHHRLARDLDLVCVDGTAGFGNRCVLPAGPLREPLSALRFADGVCVVDGPLGERDAEIVSRQARRLGPIVQARRVPVALEALDGSATQPLGVLRDCDVGLISGLARPGSLRRTLEGLGARIVSERCFPDHHAYRARDFAELDPAPTMWLTSEKDAIKILPKWLGTSALWVLRIEIELEDEAEVLDRMVARLQASGRLASKPTAASAALEPTQAEAPAVALRASPLPASPRRP